MAKHLHKQLRLSLLPGVDRFRRAETGVWELSMGSRPRDPTLFQADLGLVLPLPKRHAAFITSHFDPLEPQANCGNIREIMGSVNLPLREEFSVTICDENAKARYARR